jgi:uncharacterized membrane-anchored protein YhcB (DUF1043 family)
MEVWLAFGAGCFVGIFLGIILMALLTLTKRSDYFERLYEEENTMISGDSPTRKSKLSY